MKTYTHTLFVFLFFFFFTKNQFAQPKIITKYYEIFDNEAGRWNRVSKVSTSYNELNLPDKIDSLIWNPLNQNWQLASSRNIIYTDNRGSNEWKETGFTQDGFQFDYGEGYALYNENQCLIERQTGYSLLDLEPNIEKIEYQVNENCQVQKTMLQLSNIIGELLLNDEVEYTYTDSSIRLDGKHFNVSPNLFEYNYFDYKEFDTEGQISIHEFTLFTSGIIARLEYDYTITANETLANVNLFYYHVDEPANTNFQGNLILTDRWDQQGRLIKEDYINKRTYPLSVSSIFFKYYCDDFVKEKRREDLTNLLFEREIFEYKEQANCETEIDNFLTISPNPAQNYLKIASNLLEQSNAVIRIFAMDGRLAYERRMQSIGAFIEVNVGNFSEGAYLILIDNGSQNVVEKLLVI